MSNSPTPPPTPSFGKRLWLAFKKLFLFMLRVLLTLAILGGIVAALFYGTPVLYREYFMRDVDINRSRIHDLNAQLDHNTEFFNQRIEELQTRLNTLETERDNDKQTLSELKDQLTETDAKLQEQASSLEKLNTLTNALGELETQIASLEAQLTGYETSLAGIQNDVNGLNLETQSNQAEIEALNEQLKTSATLIILRQELELLKAMELITRAHVSMGQSNTGLARDDLQSAHDLLTALSAEVTPSQAEYLSNVIARLELALKNLSGSPSLATQDLEVAWQMLLGGLPDETPSAEDENEAALTPTPTPFSEAGQTPTPTPTSYP
jgi:uncharacterized coiled-coil protein SlyX